MLNRITRAKLLQKENRLTSLLQADLGNVSKLAGHPAEKVEAAPTGSLEDRVLAALKTCYDPELPVNIHELGLIYDLKVEPTGAVSIRMTLTSPGCPVAGSIVQEVQSKI